MTQKQIAEDIQTAVQTLRQGGIILYPTDTIWGIGCDASNEEAVKRIFQLKRREDSKAMICLVDSANRMQRYVRGVLGTSSSLPKSRLRLSWTALLVLPQA